MKRTLFLSVLTIFFSISFMCSVGCNQNPTKEQSSISEKKIKEEYDLQERCGKSCRELFSKNYDRGTGSYYNSHYNKKMNKCFMSFLQMGGPISDTRKILLEIHENKDYGVFSIKSGEIIVCFVLDRKCKSEKEWDNLIKPYMEE